MEGFKFVEQGEAQKEQLEERNPEMEAAIQNLSETVERAEVTPEEEELAGTIANEWEQAGEIVERVRPQASARFRQALLYGMAAASIFASFPKPSAEAGHLYERRRPAAVLVVAEDMAGVYSRHYPPGVERPFGESIRRSRDVLRTTGEMVGEIHRAPQTIERGGVRGVIQGVDQILWRIESLQRTFGK